VRAALVVGIVAIGCQAGPRPAFGEPPVEDTAEPAPTRPRRQLRLEVGVHEGVPWPMILAPIEDFDQMPALPVAADPPPAAPTAAGARVVEIVDGIRTSLRESRYQHSTKVRADDGVYHWDCSGMTGWILRRAAPAAFRRLGRGRPVARDFVSVIERAPADRARAGWQRIAIIADVMPGDVFAWRRPRGLPSNNTGHVGIVLDRPLPVPGLPGGWAVRIADSSSFTHQDDSRHDDPDGGFGIGSMTFLVDADGRGTHYGWGGTRSEVYVTTPIVFGRVTR
jgi:hypothetical protein